MINLQLINIKTLLVIIIIIFIYVSNREIYESNKLIINEQLYTSTVNLNIDNILWSKGYSKGNYAKKHTEHIVSVKYINKLIKEFNTTSLLMNNHNKYLWIRNTTKINQDTDLDFLAQNIDTIITPFILITTDGDRPVPSSYNNNTILTILNSDKVLLWFTQNYDRTIEHYKLKYMPIGLDLHTSRWLINNSKIKKLEYMLSRNENKIKNIILSDCHLKYSHNERKILYNTIKNNNKFYFVNKITSFENITNLYNKYQFVLSPRGNGLDCHRTWELFLAGAIIITKTTSLDNMFIDNNLPVVILQDWDELNYNLEEKLKIWYNKYYHLTLINNIYPKLTFNYWLN